jgi:hypothetical protein
VWVGGEVISGIRVRVRVRARVRVRVLGSALQEERKEPKTEESGPRSSQVFWVCV